MEKFVSNRSHVTCNDNRPKPHPGRPQLSRWEGNRCRRACLAMMRIALDGLDNSFDHLKRLESPADLLACLVRDPCAELTIDLRQGKVCWKGLACDLSPSYWALYTFFALVKKEATWDPADCDRCPNCFLASPKFSNIKD